MFRTSVFLLMTFAGCGLAQHIGFGIKGGVRATDDILGSATSDSARYVIGPMVELTLPLGFAVEANALYSHLGYRSVFNTALVSSTVEASASSWQFPIVAKYKLGFPLVKPYVEAGYGPRHTSGSPTLAWPSTTTHGFVMG